MKPVNWPCPLQGGGVGQEYAVACDSGRRFRLIIIPALFDEGNRMRRFSIEVMRRLDMAGIDCFLPDFPGCNESVQPLDRQDPAIWSKAAAAATNHFAASHVLGIRGGCMFTPPGLPTWHYAPVKAAAIVRQMLRARVLSSREAGRDETREELAQAAHASGITLAGYKLGPAFFRAFEAMAPTPAALPIHQDTVGGSGLWLRAEPDEDAAQADTLVALLAAEILK